MQMTIISLKNVRDNLLLFSC